MQMLEHLAIDQPAERPRGLRIPRASSVRISSSRPRSNWSSTRRVTRSAIAAGGSRRPIASTSTSGIGDVVSAKWAVSGRPVSRNTSSARTRRLRSRGWMRSADSASTRVSSRCSHVTPRRSAIDSSRRRSAGVAAGAGKETARQRAEIKSCATGENRQLLSRVYVADHRGGVARKLRRSVPCRRVDDVR